MKDIINGGQFMKKDWDFSLIYQEGEFDKDLQAVRDELLKVGSFQGKLADNLEEYIILSEEIGKKLYTLYTYSHMKYDLNQKDTAAFSTLKEVESLYGDYLRYSSFFQPEVIALGYDKVKELIASSDKLKEYSFMFRKMFDQQAHILGAAEEKILSNFAEVQSNHGSLYSSIAVSDNYDVEVEISTGEKLKINNGNYRYYLGILPNQEDRRVVFEAVFKYYADHRHTFASIYNGIVQNDIAIMKSRNYGSTLESYLERNKIPVSVYQSLIETTKNNTEIVKKYIELRKQYFKLDKYRTYDRFLSFAESNIEFDYETSYKIFLESAKELGNEFYELAKEALREGAVDVDIKDGKRTGAYSTSIYGKGPFILLNHNNNIDSAFTIAHEAGHSMHTILADANQPFATNNYTIFVAEIASTFNEQLFLDYLIKTSTDDNFKIALIAQSIDGILGTFYRQSLFADYEYQAHKLAEEGRTINHESLSKIMKELYHQYYDINLDEEPYKEVVWAYIPHFFFTPYYVYQYATSFSASLKIYQDVKNQKEGAFDRYLGLLKSGGSDYPVNQVLEAGVDLRTAEPFLAVVSRLTELVGLLEELLAKRG